MPSQIVLTLVILVFLTSAGCKKPLANPHLHDPIYKDFEIERKAAETAMGVEKKTIQDLEAELAAMEPREVRRKMVAREIAAREKNLTALKQKELYYSIRLEQRKKFALEDSTRAFEKNEVWPNPDELKQYQAAKKLQNVSKNWDERVPKLTKHLKYGPKGQNPASEGSEKPAEPTKPAH